jgi:hypothetical protein
MIDGLPQKSPVWWIRRLKLPKLWVVTIRAVDKRLTVGISWAAGTANCSKALLPTWSVWADENQGFY